MYHIKVPGYAQRTGKRLLLMPAYFQAGTPTRFPESTREFPVYFHYPWCESNFIRIKLPENYSLDHGDSPAGFKFPPVGEYNLKLGITSDNSTLVYKREFKFGGDGLVLFEQKQYPALKQIFDRVHENDNHMLTLKVKTPVVNSGAE
jgi:hypothetical protein